MKEEKKSEQLEEQDGIVNLEDDFIVLAIPSSTLEVDITAKVWHNGQTITVSKTMDFDEVRAAFRDAQENYIPEDAVFTLTDRGRAHLEELKERQRDRMGADLCE